MSPLLTREQVLRLHNQLIEQSGGSAGLRDAKALDSALSQPEQSFAGQPLYPDVISRIAALGFFLISNHPFIDGNKRIGHAAIEISLMMHGLEIVAEVEEQERVILATASGKLSRETFEQWVRRVTRARTERSQRDLQ